MNRDFLEKVQAEGWQIVEVFRDGCTARCPSQGCSVRAKLRQSAGVLPGPRSGDEAPDLAVQSFDELRQELRRRRKTLCLTIREVEDIAGITDDYLAKFERDNWRDGSNWGKIPNVQAAIEWANVLGYDVVLRPRPLPAATLEAVAGSRDAVKRRVKRNVRESNQPSGPALLPAPSPSQPG